MAKTSEGKRLTDAHRIAQVKLSTRTSAQAAILYDTLDVANVDASYATIQSVLSEAVESGYVESQALAERYMERFAQAEGQPPETIIRPTLDSSRLSDQLRINGPTLIKAKIKQGLFPQDAKDDSLARFLQVVQSLVLAGGRDLIDVTVRYSGRSGRYRRVTDSTPCAFCAMLASRGPIYTQESSSFRSHRGCGCNAEIVYGEWVPNSREALWRASYRQAAMDADKAGEKRVAPNGRHDEDTILRRMRRNSPKAFSDGVRKETR